MNRRLTAIALPALVALLVPAAAGAATRDVWVAATADGVERRAQRA